MIRERVRLKIYRLDEETLQRKDQFDYTEEQRSNIEDQIDYLLTGQHIIADDGLVYTISVASIDGDD